MSAHPPEAAQTKLTKNAGVLAVRLSPEDRQRVEAAAEAAGVSVSKYIESCLFRRTLKMYPILTTLAQMIAIAGSIAAPSDQSDVKCNGRPGVLNPEMLTELRSMIRSLCNAARIELEEVS